MTSKVKRNFFSFVVESTKKFVFKQIACVMQGKIFYLNIKFMKTASLYKNFFKL